MDKITGKQLIEDIDESVAKRIAAKINAELLEALKLMMIEQELLINQGKLLRRTASFSNAQRVIIKVESMKKHGN